MDKCKTKFLLTREENLSNESSKHFNQILFAINLKCGRFKEGILTSLLRLLSSWRTFKVIFCKLNNTKLKLLQFPRPLPRCAFLFDHQNAIKIGYEFHFSHLNKNRKSFSFFIQLRFPATFDMTCKIFSSKFKL